MRRDTRRLHPTAVAAWMLQLPKDDWGDTIPLEEFLAGKCPFHPYGCGDAAAHRREFEAHADSYDVADGDQRLRRTPGVAFGSTAGRHVIYWKHQENGTTFRSGQVRDLAGFADYTETV